MARLCDPRAAVAVACCGGAAGVAGVRSAAWALVLVGLWLAFLVPDARGKLRRLLPLVSGLGILVLLLPFAPRAAGSTLLRGAATSLAVAGAALAGGGVALTAAFAAAGAPPSAVAFLLVLARHAAGVREEARRAFDALALRGGWERWAVRWRSVGTLLAALLAAAFARADRTAEALTLRGFAGRMPRLARFEPLAQAPHLLLAGALLALALAEVPTWGH